jgi:hypothetical protein
MMDEYIRNFLMSSAAKAQKDAFTTARQSGKRTTVVTRTEHGDACKWCQSLAGTYENPGGDVFARHGGCMGKIVTKGYMSKNGLLHNYKAGKSGSIGAAAPISTDGGQVVFRGTGSNVSSAGLELGSGFYVARDTATASNFGNVAQLSLPLKSRDILTIASDNQYQKLIMDAQKWTVRTGGSLDSNDFIPAYVRYLGYKAAEVSPAVDPLGGIAIYDPAIIKKMQKQMAK